MHWIFGLFFLVGTLFGQSLSLDRPRLLVGERLIASFSGAKGRSDRLVIVPVESPGQAILASRFLDGSQEDPPAVKPAGSVRFLPLNLAPGAYELRWLSGSDDRVLVSRAFQVVQASVPPKRPALERDFTLMTFNIWVQGEKGFGGLPRVAEVIAQSGADVVLLQEANAASTRRLTTLLKAYPGYQDLVGSEQTAILSRFPIEEEYTAPGLKGYGVRIRLKNGQRIRCVNSHLRPYPYGPYELRDNKTVEEVLAIEEQTRGAELREILAKILDAKDRELPTFFGGDHNCPSHLDWIADNKDQNFDAMVQWPVSKLLANAGYKDLFREVHPNPVRVRGLTWSPGYPKNKLALDDVHDRIDMLYFRRGFAMDAVAVDAWTLDDDPWPSDHRAVVAALRWKKTTAGDR